MGEAAVKLGRAIGYSNAGTVEMILAPDGQFYFLEVNTRLQVEHPVTEAVSDLDLVELQIRVARGEPLPLDQEMIDTLMSGWAIECRIYAEDPRQGFLPQSGKVLEWAPPSAEWLRIDTGVESGSEVSIYYDPMIAKVIAWGVDRGQAVDRLRWALERLSVQGLRTNRELLIHLLDHPAFWVGELSTHFIDEHMSEVLGAPVSADAVRDAAWAITLHGHAQRAAARILPSLRTGFRNSRYADAAVSYAHGEQRVAVTYADLGGGRFRLGFALDGGEAVREEVRLVAVDGARVTFEDAAGHRKTVRVVSEELRHYAMIGAQDLVLIEEPRFPDRSAESAADGAFAPMPGKIVKVLVTQGQEVKTGQILVIMEAMKMEHSIGAPHDGVVAEVRVSEGQQVSEGHVVVVVREPGDEG
jgi:acetyl/propionyl-CoA carboxylase alpha subunit